MDPAGPRFWDGDREAIPELEANRLDKDAAAFVDAIHTDGSFRPTGSPSFRNGEHFGTLWQTGHLDFYPDGGVWQKGCGVLGVNAVCSHSRAVVYYLHSINNKDLFPSTACRFKKNWVTRIDKCVEIDSKRNLKFNIGEDAYYQYCGNDLECNGKPRRIVANRVAYSCWSFNGYNNNWFKRC